VASRLAPMWTGGGRGSDVSLEGGAAIYCSKQVCHEDIVWWIVA